MTQTDETVFIHIAQAAENVVETAINRFREKREHARKEASQDGAANTDPALTETTCQGGS